MAPLSPHERVKLSTSRRLPPRYPIDRQTSTSVSLRLKVQTWGNQPTSVANQGAPSVSLPMPQAPVPMAQPKRQDSIDQGMVALTSTIGGPEAHRNVDKTKKGVAWTHANTPNIILRRLTTNGLSFRLGMRTRDTLKEKLDIQVGG